VYRADVCPRKAGLYPDYHPSAHFLALFAATLFAGCVACPLSLLHDLPQVESRESFAQELYVQAICAIRLAEFPRSPSLWTFAAFVILNSTWLREEQPLACCSFIGMAFRVAQMIGKQQTPR
jgi:hypothetical protein